MLQKLLNNKILIAQLFFLIGLLAMVRAFEHQLFYDPFLDYFKGESTLPYPQTDSLRLYLSLFLRYCLNTVISLVILYVVFKDVALVRFSAVLYGIFFVVLLVGFYGCLNYCDESCRMVLFYIRRFLIQPLFILLFLPGFYFQVQSQKK
ncbi:exosortase F system-associated membrane protein [Flavobacterium humi]|uniref:Exosortase F system-associated protein n=1 Tax=Flavobacterium humi TaxID=2562683 RepID=A0A4Z0L7I0_9FLAO|nr:exosortase F system-associated protein [Flavobacterium humi]TGD56952.1 exosortase F system-associated protein [Flavobacterium humi]